MFKPLDYRPLLEQRPAAFAHAIPVRRQRERWPDGAGVRMFVRVLRLLNDYPAALIKAVMTQALITAWSGIKAGSLALRLLLEVRQQYLLD